jgi:hypothetical protein
MAKPASSETPAQAANLATGSATARSVRSGATRAARESSCQKTAAANPRVHAGRALEIAGEGQRQDRDRATHEHGRRADQQCREHHVECESQARVADGAEQRDVLGNSEESRKQQRVESDAGLDECVEVEQPRGTRAPTSALHAPPRGAAEERVARREPAEEDREHRRRGLAVGSEERRQVLLPRDLVDQAGEARQHREQQCRDVDHCPASPGWK